MSDDASILKEFLVSLGFKIDQKSLSKFDAALVKTTKEAFAFATTLTGVAVATTAFVDKVASKMEDLYWASVRLRDGVANIQDFQLGISKLGGTAEGALSSLENVAAFIRTQPFAEGLLHNLGVQTRDANGNLRKTIDIVRDFAHLPMPYWLKVRFAQRFGIDERTLQAITREAPNAENKVSEMYKAMGINADDAAKQSMEFENQLRDLGAVMGVVGVVLERTLLPFVKGFVTIATTLVTWLAKLDAATDGWASTLIYLGVVVGGVALLFGWIPALIAGLALATAAIIGNWNKIKATISAGINWIRTKYNAVASFLGLPHWGGGGPQDKPKVPGAPDWRTREANLGANSLAGANDNTEANSAVTGKALAFFTKAGWSANQAAGIVANLMHESGLRANAVGDHGGAYGIAQWHKDRQAAFAAWAGHDIRQSTLEEQLAFVNHELLSGAEQFAGKMIRGARTAAEAGAAVSKYYERPADTAGQAAARGRTAASLVDGARLSGGGGSKTVVIQQKTDIKVSGSDATSTGRAVGREQGRVNGDLVRNFAGAQS